jgi:hypothetical protein
MNARVFECLPIPAPPDSSTTSSLPMEFPFSSQAAQGPDAAAIPSARSPGAIKPSRRAEGSPLLSIGIVPRGSKSFAFGIEDIEQRTD